ncbi:uncharacterized protein [Dysidea avara]|uniref:uncharacterized protein isoform X2 n=1 Tax=Dysidea avara TaxID=196820 RepID=UPI0033275A6C
METTPTRPFSRSKICRDNSSDPDYAPVSKRLRTELKVAPDLPTTHLFLETEPTPTSSPAPLLEGSLSLTSTISGGVEVVNPIEEEMYGETSNSSEARVSSVESSAMELIPKDDESSRSGLSENDRSVERDGISTVPPLSHFQQLVVDKFPELKPTFLEDSHKNSILEITHRTVHYHPPAGYVNRVRMVLYVNSNGDRYCYNVQALLVSVKEGVVSTDKEFVELCNSLRHCKGFVFCPGISYQRYQDEYYSVLRFHNKQVNLTESPFLRVESKSCLRWYKLPKNATFAEQASDEVLCTHCKRLVSRLEDRKKISENVSPCRRVKRQSASSNYPIMYLSPASVKKRKENMQAERSKDKALLAKFSKLDITLDDSQHDEMCRITDELETHHKDQLEDIYQEAGGSREAIKDIWQADKERADFYKDQKKNGCGKRGNRWSLVTIRIALSVFVRSPAAYEALKSFNILHLPARSTLQAYTGCFLHEGGASWESIAKQVELFQQFKASQKAQGKLEPLADGVLIFDEVKVISRLMWNSRSQTIIGLAMNAEDQQSLHDVYELFHKDKAVEQTSYIMQFLWRDLTSSFDIVGPYFTSSENFTAKVIHACVLETIQLFQIHGFSTSLLVCDGAAPNLTVVKSTHGHSGAYNINSELSDQYEVKPYFVNPFNPPHLIHWLICPSHQLKNMINALHSSRPGGTKRFTLDDKQFGWQTIVDMFDRECQRVKNGNARMIPKLREAHIIRDSWIKLNVAPAKIMQQEQVLGELFDYTQQHQDANQVKYTMKYLEACSKIFENGLLSHDRVTDVNSAILKNIREGFKFFRSWHNSLSEAATPNQPIQPNKFLAWQTWDLLRICVYGFESFCTYFLNRYPNRFVSPLRVSGSAVESLFSQYKRSAGGKLDAINYPISRAAHLIKETVSTHHSGSGYRNQSLCTFQGDVCLKRKQYNKLQK